jgi:hypothetical protein
MADGGYPVANQEDINNMNVGQMEDLHLIQSARPQNPVTLKPDFDYTNIGYLFPQNDATEKLIVRGQLKHSWNIGTFIFPHIHVVLEQAGSPVFKFDYKIYDPNNDDVPTVYGTYTMDTISFTWASGSKSAMVYNTTGITCTGLTESTIIKGFIYRDDNSYGADILVDDIDIHYYSSKFGKDI